MEAALCVQGSRAYVWSFARPQNPKLLLVLDHSEPSKPQAAATDGGGGARAGDGATRDQEPGAPGAAGDVLPAKKSDMRWLTRSDLDGLPAAGEGDDEAAAAATAAAADARREEREREARLAEMPGLVAEAIRDAAEDVPEVTQVRVRLGDRRSCAPHAIVSQRWCLHVCEYELHALAFAKDDLTPLMHTPPPPTDPLGGVPRVVGDGGGR